MIFTSLAYNIILSSIEIVILREGKAERRI